MIENSAIHGTFAIERSYLATPSRVFGAFADAEARNTWGDTGEAEEPEGGANYELDFRIGGCERFGWKMHGRIYYYDARYYDIVPDQRIIYSYEMYADGARISVSVATIEFAKNGDGTALTWTEQGAYLDGFDGPEAGRAREHGTAALLDGLGRYLESFRR
jgi:uncharacterized protein YndB with AHSA1/START domain